MLPPLLMEAAMRFAFLLVGLLAACAGQRPYQMTQQDYDQLERHRRWSEHQAAVAAAAEAALTPAERAQRDLDRAKAVREEELFQRALSNSPDYAAAVRRAAVANVEATRVLPRQKDAAVAAEEARLSDAVEQRRRASIASTEAANRSARYAQAVTACDLQAAQIEASMFSRRSILNLDGMIAGAQARNACMASITP